MIDDALIGFDASDAALWMFSPATAMARMWQARAAEAAAAVPTDTVRDITQTSAYKAMLTQGVDAMNRGAAADKARGDALQALAAVRAAPVQSAAPIAINVPSFALGFRQGRR